MQSRFEANVFFHASDCQRFKLSYCTCNTDFSSSTFNCDVICSDKCFQVENVSEFKYLGLVIDSRMSFFNHTENLRLYFRSTLRNFYYLRNVCSTELLTKIYYGIFHSRLQYGIACWGGTYFNRIQPLLILQKHVLKRICWKSRRYPSFPLFRDLKILPVRHFLL